MPANQALFRLPVLREPPDRLSGPGSVDQRPTAAAKQTAARNEAPDYDRIHLSYVRKRTERI